VLGPNKSAFTSLRTILACSHESMRLGTGPENVHQAGSQMRVRGGGREKTFARVGVGEYFMRAVCPMV
jgi:hypothetical protein